MTEMLTQNRDGSWGPSIPEPFWFRTWRTWFRSKPGCYPCSVDVGRPVTFVSREEHDEHYREEHLPRRRNCGHRKPPREGPPPPGPRAYPKWCVLPPGHKGDHDYDRRIWG